MFLVSNLDTKVDEFLLKNSDRACSLLLSGPLGLRGDALADTPPVEHQKIVKCFLNLT